jgi:hypothetical protein
MNNKAYRFLAVAALATAGASVQAQSLPVDVKPTCTVSPAEFKKWFGGTVTANGAVTFADSVTFKHENDCDFNRWSEQMFSWLVSPGYGGSRVFDSPLFFTVSEEDSQHQRHLIPHVPGKPRLMAAFHAQLGSNISVGQAGGSGVLMSQSQSIVYYSIDVNDVYAYFLTKVKQQDGSKVGKYPDFPTSLKDLVFDKTQPPAFADLHALAMEIKTSWVIAGTLASQGLDKKDYVTIEAVIPNYVTGQCTVSHQTTPVACLVVDSAKPTRTEQMALVGMHVVGSANGHPEMIWATFEHDSNAPNSPYPYENKAGKTTWQQASTTGNWLFSANGSTGPFNTEDMTFVTSNGQGQIVPSQFKAVGPSDTLRMNAWGTNWLNPSVVTNNTGVISVNHSVLSQFLAGDIRRHYHYIGSTWTTDGTNPAVATNQVGTNLLNNATMETYQQFPQPNLNCFSCHQGNLPTNGLDPDGLSHIFKALNPLP